MKEEINLLPPVAKSRRRRRLFWNRTNRLFWVLIVVLATGGVSLAALMGVYRATAAEVRQVIATTRDDSEMVDAEVETVNRFARSFYAVVQAQPPFVGRVSELLRVVPEQTVLTTLDFKRSERVLVVEGRVDSIEQLVEMQKAFEGLSWVESVEAPLQNFATEQQGQFSFTLTLVKGNGI